MLQPARMLLRRAVAPALLRGPQRAALSATAQGAAGAADAAQAPSDQAAARNGSSAEDTKKIQELEARLKETEDKYVRTLAEMENVRMRARRDVDSTKQFAVSSFAKDLLDVADTLDMALNSVKPEQLAANAELKTLYEGVSMTDRELYKIFARYNITVFDPLKQPFDPNFHSALFEMDDPSLEPGTVGVVHKKGFMIYDRPLRAAQVGVVRKR